MFNNPQKNGILFSPPLSLSPQHSKNEVLKEALEKQKNKEKEREREREREGEKKCQIAIVTM